MTRADEVSAWARELAGSELVPDVLINNAALINPSVRRYGKWPLKISIALST